MTAHRGRRRWIVVGALLGLAVAVRVGTMFYGSLSAEDATVALMAKHFLSGENFPAFFYRQTYMGSLNGIHLVPALYVFGPSALLVRLNAVVWSPCSRSASITSGRRIFDEPSGLVTLALAALPPFLLVYWSTVAEPHLETNVLGVWLLVLALAALTARSEPGGRGRSWCSGSWRAWPCGPASRWSWSWSRPSRCWSSGVRACCSAAAAP